MGQKINPFGFRLGVSQEHRANWFAKSNKYSELLKEDQKIRNCVKNYVTQNVRSTFNYGGISEIRIERNTDLVQIEIHTAFPALLANSRNRGSTQNSERGLEHLKRSIESILIPKNLKLKMILVEMKKPYAEAIILAEYIALQLESRGAFRKIMKKAIELADEKGNVHGIKIQIAGRLNGAEIARVEWAREGRVPLQTLRAKIDYCHYRAQTIYGVLGIKVWIFQ
jgi:small subunit ribosomal protein S3